MKYERRIVLFLDVLGFRKLIEENPKAVGKTNRKVAFILKEFQSFFGKKVPEVYKTSKKICRFSDSVAISMKTGSNEDFGLLLDRLRILQAQLLMGEVVLRGGISIGAMVHTSKAMFGPAFLKAYDLESKKAKYPRIILDDDILKELGNEPNLSSFQQIIFKDFDGTYYIDYIENTDDLYDDENSHNYFNESLDKVIEENLINPNTATLEKYLWLAAKFNSRKKQHFYHSKLKQSDWYHSTIDASTVDVGKINLGQFFNNRNSS
ncbi:MAG: hypothetical protein EAZ47_08440 [Bacteroidetes bacterium]|nr:MAG: hypothetical protein EAY72_07210 [Bacteroidota bacterium]TAE68234.1 MAG: hypothetical protein EAY68_04715 [Bacteroidota bacterium]TAF92584.1 MAG: hypothetical protein EAZ47_08440 [Bacteroidota bacterium]